MPGLVVVAELAVLHLVDVEVHWSASIIDKTIICGVSQAAIIRVRVRVLLIFFQRFFDVFKN